MPTNQCSNWDLPVMWSRLRYGASRTGSVFWSVWLSCCWRRIILCWLLATCDRWFWTCWSGTQRGSKLAAGSTMTSTSAYVWPSANSSASVLMRRRKWTLFSSHWAWETSPLFTLPCKDAGAGLGCCTRTHGWVYLLGGLRAEMRWGPLFTSSTTAITSPVYHLNNLNKLHRFICLA